MSPQQQDKLTSSAARIYLSPHEWVWTQEETVEICLKLLRQNDRVKDLEQELASLGLLRAALIECRRAMLGRVPPKSTAWALSEVALSVSSPNKD